MLASRISLVRRLLLGIAVAFAPVVTVPPMSATAQVERIIISGASGNPVAKRSRSARTRRARQPLDPREPYARRAQGIRSIKVECSVRRIHEPESLPAAYAGGTRMPLISVGGSGGHRRGPSEARYRRGECRRRQTHRLYLIRRHHARRCRGDAPPTTKRPRTR